MSQTGLELLVYPRLVLKSQSFCLGLSSSGLHVCVNKPGFIMALDSEAKQRTGVAAQGVRAPVVSKHKDLSLDPRSHIKSWAWPCALSDNFSAE